MITFKNKGLQNHTVDLYFSFARGETFMTKTKSGWLQTLVEIGMIYVSLYAIVFLIGVYSFTIVTDLPTDRDKNGSGLFLGTLVNCVPFLLLGWRAHFFHNRNIHTVAIATVVTSFLLEKFLPVCFAYVFSPADPFVLLSEELPYYIFGINYILYGTLLSCLSFYIGLFVRRSLKQHTAS